MSINQLIKLTFEAMKTDYQVVLMSILYVALPTIGLVILIMFAIKFFRRMMGY